MSSILQKQNISVFCPPTIKTFKLQNIRHNNTKSLFICQSKKRDGQAKENFSLKEVISSSSIPLGATLAVILLTSTIVPEEALAARSGGRIGGSSFRSMPRVSRGGGYTQVNYYSSPSLVAPPLVGGYGLGGGYGYGGISLMPSFFLPIGFGGFFNLFIALIIISAIFNTIRNFGNRRDDDLDDF